MAERVDSLKCGTENRIGPHSFGTTSHIINTGSQPIARQPTPRGIILVMVKGEGSNLTPPINLYRG